MKAFKKLLCGGKLKTWIENPFKKGGKIFLLFDFTHLLKCIYHNFRATECFVCPPFDDDTSTSANIYPNFAHIRQLQHLELGKPLKISHKLTDKVIAPMALEKTNVMLANALFDESTINGLEFYAKNGFGQFYHTAKFLRIIRNWWDTFNVKSIYKGKHKRNEFMHAIIKENVDKVTSYLESFSKWVKEWKSEYPDFGLSSPTFNALLHTVKAVKELCTFLLDCDNNGIEYILLGFLQQDYLEGRFGWYRQLAGGNYFCAVIQFLQAEKTIRLRNLVQDGYNLKEIANIFKDANDVTSEYLKQQSLWFSGKLFEFDFTELTTTDIPITYYVAGYIAKHLLKKSKCKYCNTLLSKNNEPLEVDIDQNVVAAVGEGDAFINAISRGGLIKPSELLYITCTHAYKKQ